MGENNACSHNLAYIIRDLASGGLIGYCVKCSAHISDIGKYSQLQNSFYRKGEFEWPIYERNSYETKETAVVPSIAPKEEGLFCYNILLRSKANVDSLVSFLSKYGQVDEKWVKDDLLKLECRFEDAEQLYNEFKHKTSDSPLNNISVLTQPKKK
jgi:hypothetical protein